MKSRARRATPRPVTTTPPDSGRESPEAPIRATRSGDAPALARMHVDAWAETYTGLLPAVALAEFDVATRRAWWSAQIERGTTRIRIAPGLGFVAMGPQREPRLARRWPDELYALYVLRRAHGTGLGRRLLDAADAGRPFSALVLDGNARALAFYEKAGGRFVERRKLDDGWPDDLLYGWDRTSDQTADHTADDGPHHPS